MQPRDPIVVEPNEDRPIPAGAWVFVICYVLISFTWLIVMLRLDRGPGSAWLPGAMSCFAALLLLMLIVGAVSSRKQLAAFGEVFFLQEPTSLAMGGRLAGTVVIPTPRPAGRTLTAELSCFRITRDRNSESEEEAWRGRQEVALVERDGNAVAAIAIELPAPFPEMDDPDDPAARRPDSWRWEMGVSVEMPGLDLARSFAIDGVAIPPPRTAGAPETKPAQVPAAHGATPGKADWSSTLVLIAVNVLPLVGVMAWGWRAQDLIYLYWIETLVICAFGLPRVYFSEPDYRKSVERGLAAGRWARAKAYSSPLFALVVLYGFACFIEGEVLFNALDPGPVKFFGFADVFRAVRALVREPGMAFALLALVASAMYSFFRDYLGRGQYRVMGVDELVQQPVNRVIAMWFFLIFASPLVRDAPRVALGILIAFKIFIDAASHRYDVRPRGASAHR